MCIVERPTFFDTNCVKSYFILFLIVLYFMIIVYHRYVCMAAPYSF